MWNNYLVKDTDEHFEVVVINDYCVDCYVDGELTFSCLTEDRQSDIDSLIEHGFELYM